MSKFIYCCKLVVLRYKIFKELGVRIMTHAQADLIEVREVGMSSVGEVVDQVSSSG